MATYGQNFLRVTISGDVGSTTARQDVWQTGFDLIDRPLSPGWSERVPAGLADRIAELWTTFWSTAGIGALFGTGCVVRQIRVARVDASNGREINSPDALQIHTFQTPLTGAGASWNPDVAMAVSFLNRDRLRGVGRWGRMFLPTFNASSVLNGGRIPSTTRNLVGAALATFFANLSGFTSGLRLANVPANSDSVFPVEELRIDDLLDTQRRRQNRFQINQSFYPVNFTETPTADADQEGGGMEGGMGDETSEPQYDFGPLYQVVSQDDDE